MLFLNTGCIVPGSLPAKCQAKIIEHNLNIFCKCVSQVCEIELGFKENEIQHIVITVPKVLTANKRKLTQIFDFLHNTMKVPHHLIAKFPQVD